MGNDYKRLMLLCSLVSCGTGLVVYIAAALIIPEDDSIVG